MVVVAQPREPALQTVLGLGAPEVLEQLVRSHEVDAGALLDRAQPEGDRQMRLADTKGVGRVDPFGRLQPTMKFFSAIPPAHVSQPTDNELEKSGLNATVA